MMLGHALLFIGLDHLQPGLISFLSTVGLTDVEVVQKTLQASHHVSGALHN